ncbi:uncharacterized protein LOC106078987 [Biomphalaria glabrata]|uniref:Uncharacterized protein LOC106078987 n=1 Tax=Biomphalaria glabrata TaxID=6526 RepID=A0A9W3AC61_BIOGL|nr:uncharacterized protein LOC106078987 [Biomphalaria glabrata]
MVILILVIFCFANMLISDSCEIGWFGSKCQYKCHCQQNCNDMGDCPGACKSGWFGYKCQYRDVALSDVIRTEPPIVHSVDILKDNNDSTCGATTEIRIRWTRSYFIYWTRLVLPNPGHFYFGVRVFIRQKVSLIMQEVTTPVLIIHKNILDIYLSLDKPIDTLILQSNASNIVCSLWVSAGRNVALKQNTVQSSTDNISLSQPGHAVDGDKTTCSKTLKDDSQSHWTVTFPHSYFIRDFVFMFEDQFTLKWYTMLLLDDVSKTAVRHIGFDAETSNDLSQEETINVTSITIAVHAHARGDSSLVLCEFEAYAECEPRKWGLECNNDCNSSCTQGCRTDDGLCTDHCLGYLDPPLCTKACENGFYGLNCSHKCSALCKDQNCHTENGQCLQCISGHKGIYCTEKCETPFWGFNCTSICSQHCFKDGICFADTGECQYGCQKGYELPICIKECTVGFYGISCLQTCPANCKDRQCHHVSGKCHQCVTGYLGDLCETKCAAGFYGDNCTNNCSDKCLNQTCDATTGRCSHCMKGLQALYCEQGLMLYNPRGFFSRKD